MKFSEIKKKLIMILPGLLLLQPVFAGGNRDYMRETGKIQVVTAVIVVIFLGIAWYVFRLDRKLTKLEGQIQDENERKN